MSKNREAEEIIVQHGGHVNDGAAKKEKPDKGYPTDYRTDYPPAYPPDYPKDYDPGYPKYVYPGYPSPFPSDYPQDYPPEYPTDYQPVVPPDYPIPYPGKVKAGYPRGLFETPIPIPGMFDGEIFASVYEVGGVAPATIIRADQTWGVLVKWKTSGCLVPMICGEWCIQIHLESMGPGPELEWPKKPHYVPLDPCAAKGKYHTVYYKCNIVCPPGIVEADHCSTPYKCVTTLTYHDPCGKPGAIAAHVEGPMLQFFMANKYYK
jgi:hypothetical protein